MAATDKKLHFSKKELLWPILFVLILYIFLPQISSFKSSLHLLAHPNVYFLVIAVIFIILTYFEAAATYYLLAIKSINYLEEVFVQLATMFVNRLLPAGIGGIGANYDYLRHKKHKASQAASIVATNNIMGIIGHLSIVVVAISLSTSRQIIPPHLGPTAGTVVKYLGLVIIVVALVAFISGGDRLMKFLRGIRVQLMAYEHRPGRTFSALLTQMALTLSNVLCLSYSAKAVGVHLSFVVILIIFTFGSGIRNITPTPGGLGGFEAGLIAGFVAYHVVSADALAAVLLYRLISYWVPLVFGLIAFIFAQRLGWFKH